tara:strand:+ start:1358 stop:1810 length:453 start_codon:yes stop_codon:yes gene_type:complete
MINSIERLLRLDSIRVNKIAELIYYMLIGFSITILFSNLLENDDYMPYVFKTYDYDAAPMRTLLIDLVIDLSIFVVFFYYIRKLAISIPFLFAGKNYTPNLKNEAGIGVEMGVFIIIFIATKTLAGKLEALNDKVQKHFSSFKEGFSINL